MLLSLIYNNNRYLIVNGIMIKIIKLFFAQNLIFANEIDWKIICLKMKNKYENKYIFCFHLFLQKSFNLR